MEFNIDEKIIELFPDVKIGVLVAENVDNKHSSNEFLEKSLTIQKQIREDLDLNSLVENPKIKDFREAYITFGAKPKTYKNSLEALLRRILKGDSLPSINQIVDIYNYISVKHKLPVGGDDIDKVDKNITLTFSDGIKKFTILGSDNYEEVLKGEVVYCDESEILCRRWNWRECEKSKMTTNTKNVCLIVEGLKSTSKEELEIALDELQELIETYCKGIFKKVILDSKCLKVKIC